MKKGGVPLVPTPTAPVKPILPGGLPGMQAGIPKMGFGHVPVNLADLGLTPGPLGGRRTNPETRAKIADIYRRAKAEEAAAPITLMGAAAEEGIQLGSEQPQAPQVPPNPPTPRLPEPPPPAALGQPSLPEPPPPPDEPKPNTLASSALAEAAANSRTKTPMQVMAESGAENRIKGLQLDSGFMNAVLWKASSERREYFDKNRCRPVDWSALFTAYDIRQDVLIWTKPDEVWATFRTMTSDDEALARRVIAEEYSKTDADYEVGAVITTVAAGLVRVKDMVLPGIPLPSKGDYKDRLAAMKARVAMVLRLPYALATDLSINYAWFVLRVQEEQRSGELGNG